jgi:hypothetical protein
MQVFMADKSVDGPAVRHDFFHFIKKYVGVTKNKDFMTVDDWVFGAISNSSSDLLLQMDIEGYEYEVLLGSVKTLLRYQPGFIQIEMNWHALFRNNPLLKISTQLSAYRCFQILPFGDVLYEVDPRNPIRNFCAIFPYYVCYLNTNSLKA